MTDANTPARKSASPDERTHVLDITNKTLEEGDAVIAECGVILGEARAVRSGDADPALCPHCNEGKPDILFTSKERY